MRQAVGRLADSGRPLLVGLAVMGATSFAVLRSDVSARPAVDVAVPKPPVVRIEQTAEYVKVHLHNMNDDWGLRDQPISIMLIGKTVHFQRSYWPEGPARRWPDGRRVDCCMIRLLPPNGDYTITLLPQDDEIVDARIQPRGKDPWERM